MNNYFLTILIINIDLIKSKSTGVRGMAGKMVADDRPLGEAMEQM